MQMNAIASDKHSPCSPHNSSSCSFIAQFSWIISWHLAYRNVATAWLGSHFQVQASSMCPLFLYAESLFSIQGLRFSQSISLAHLPTTEPTASWHHNGHCRPSAAGITSQAAVDRWSLFILFSKRYSMPGSSAKTIASAANFRHICSWPVLVFWLLVGF